MTFNKIKLIIGSLLCIVVLIVIYLQNNTYDSIVNIKSINDISEASGYGIVYKKNSSSYIITNYHIVKNSKKIIINNKIEAKLLNGDEYEDIAILEVLTTNFNVAKISKKLNSKIVYTINSVDLNKRIKGKIIEKDSDVLVNLSDGNYILKAIKTTLKLKPGNSGGPLFDNKNKVVGIVTMMDDNYGYAIDINKALEVANKLEKGKIIRPEINFQVASVKNKEVLNQYNLITSIKEGVIVTKVFGNSNDIKVGDVITNINGNSVIDVAHFKYYVYNSNGEINLTLYRGKEKINAKIKG